MKTAAERQKERRKRMKAQGLVKLEVWVAPADRQAVRRFVQGLRDGTPTPTTGMNERSGKMAEHTVQGLFDLLSGTEDVKDGTIAVEMLEGADPVIEAFVHDREEFPVFLSVAGEQVLAVTYLWTTADVKEGRAAELHEELLRANLPVPLSSFSMIGDQYVIFGALSSGSGAAEFVTEILTLSDNTLDTLEAFRDYLNA